MYSLYRAWLMRDAVSTPPDVIVTVGGPHPLTPAPNKCQQFAAHRHVLAAHSGYLKALLSSTPGHSLSVPNIGAETFAPLLTYMYTGYLDVNVDNIYSILLATHLLHMPRALDHCRAFLIQNQPLGTLHPTVDHPPTLVKPIPSRKMLPAFDTPNFWPHFPYSLPPPPPLVLPDRRSPFEAIPPTTPPHSYPAGEPASDTTLTVNTARKRPRSPLAIPSTSTNRSTSPCLSDVSRDSVHEDVKLSKPAATSQPKKTEVAGEKTKVVIDVACCDGPVRFHRVLNANYGFAVDEIVVDSSKHQENAGIDSIRKELALRRSAQANHLIPKKIAKLAVPPTVEDPPMREREPNLVELCPRKSHNIEHNMEVRDNPQPETSFTNQNPPRDDAAQNLATSSNDGHDVEEHTNQPEVHETLDRSGSSSDFSVGGASSCSMNPAKQGSADNIYTCVYCNHTFKSHYCYQKHARRHINPVTLDMNNLVDRIANKTAACDQPGNKTPEKSPPGVRREVRLLDMNVQYYPCKTCGSKFPSYYFVHKHRKMCHADEADDITASEESQTQHSQSTTINSV